MLMDGIELIEGSNVDNLTINSGGAATQAALTPTAGELFYRDDLNEFQVYITGTGWQALGTKGSLTTHEADATIHITSAQNALLDGLSGTLTSAHLNHCEGVTNPIQGQLDAKAPLASPALTGTPTATTATTGDNTTRIATTAFVTQEIAAAPTGAQVAVLSGVITDGGTIPLPSGYTEGQCKWMVSMANTNQSIWGNVGNGYKAMECHANGTRVVTCQARYGNDGYGGTAPISEDANYIIIGVK